MQAINYRMLNTTPTLAMLIINSMLYIIMWHRNKIFLSQMKSYFFVYSSEQFNNIVKNSSLLKRA